VSNYSPDLNSVNPTGRRITPQGQSTVQTRNRPGSPVTTFVALLVVIGIAAIACRLIKKGGGIRSGLPSDTVEVLGHKILAHRQAIQIVRVGTRILVLNSSADGLSTLSEITDPTEVSALEHSCRSQPPTKSVAELFAPRQKITTRESLRDGRAIRSELQRDAPLGDMHA
jgi:flagellar biogenesis protein FliO